ncbi:hypothetical protein QG37_04409 [Candidozyma auris]|uniref:Uncharacterized protein n=1 Tax=Candidozyma auris TaxID=498019 RepID=A0A0L0NX11_CANAR|nr:hypothetical protein QG37_04409 [[Candida] auris]
MWNMTETRVFLFKLEGYTEDTIKAYSIKQRLNKRRFLGIDDGNLEKSIPQDSTDLLSSKEVSNR